MKKIEPLTPLAEALRLAALGYYVVPLHESADGICSCHKGAACRTPAKHPRTTHGKDEGTRDEAQIRHWWAQWPTAGIGVCIELSGLVLVSPDSEQWQKTFRSWFLPTTTHYRSRVDEPWHEGFLYRRSADCPIAMINKSGLYDVMSNGLAVVPPSIHPKTGDVRHWITEPIAVDDLPECPRQAVDMLIEQKNKRPPTTAGAANDDTPPVRLRGDALAHWSGERHATGDRSGALFVIAKDLYRANATIPTIAAALAERDVALGFNKYATRQDAEIRYLETAQRAVADVDASPDLRFVRDEPAEPCSQRVAELEAENAYLRGEVERLKGRISQFFQVIRNPNVKAEKLTALAVINEVASAESREVDREGWVPVPRARIADKCGNSEATVSTHIGRLDDWGVFEKRVVRKPTPGVVTPDGEVLNDPDRPMFISELQVRLRGTPETTLDTLATLTPFNAKKHGGKRVVCPDHPNATLVVRKTVSCSECGQIVDINESYQTPEGLPTSRPEHLKSRDVISDEEAESGGNVTIGSQDVISGEGAPLFAASESRKSILRFQPNDFDMCQMPGCQSQLFAAESRRLGYCETHRRDVYGYVAAAGGAM